MADKLFKITNEELEKARQPTAEGLAMFYNLIFSDRGYTLPPHLYPVVEALADERIKRMMLIIGPGSGKSMLISTIFPAWDLGLNSGETILNIAGAGDLAVGFVRSVMSLVESSRTYSAIFPHVHPDKKLGWSSGAGLFVAGRPPGLPDPSYGAYGLTSSALSGKHGTILIMDDLHDKDNSSTPHQIEQVVNTYYSNLRGRADPRGARLLMAGRRWAEKDLYGHLMASDDWVVMTLPAIRRATDEPKQFLSYDIYVPEGLECVFSVKDLKGGWRSWPYAEADKPESKKYLFFWPGMPSKEEELLEVKKGNPAVFKATYQGDPTDAEGRIFRAIDFRYGKFDINFLRENGASIIQAWDTAYSAETTADYSACVTAALVPCNENHRDEEDECTEHWDVYILDVFRKRLDFGDLTQAMLDKNSEFKPELVLVEKKASGAPAIAVLKDRIPVIPVDPGSLSKRARAVNGAHAGSAQGWFRSGRVVFQSPAEWLDPYEAELEHFTGKKGDTDDQVDPTVYLINYAIDLSRSEGVMAAEAERMLEMMVKRESWSEDQAMLAGLYENPIEDPFQYTCSHCIHYQMQNNNLCDLHHMVTNALNSCEYCDSEPDVGPLGLGAAGGGAIIAGLADPVSGDISLFDMLNLTKS